MNDHQTGLIDGFADGCLMEEYPSVNPGINSTWEETNINSSKVKDFRSYICGYWAGINLSNVYLVSMGVLYE